MADEQNELKHVNWKEIFGFSFIFKSFQMARQPSKMILALGAVLTLVISGWALDCIWSSWDGTARNNEIRHYVNVSPTDFANWKTGWQDKRLDNAASLLAGAREQAHTLVVYSATMGGNPSRYLGRAFKSTLKDYNAENEAEYKRPNYRNILSLAKSNGDDWSDLLDKAEDVFGDEIEKIETVLSDSYELAEEKIETDDSLDEDETDEATVALDSHYRHAKRSITTRKVKFYTSLSEIHGKPIFASFIDFEWDCLRKAISATSKGMIFTGMDGYRKIQLARQVPPGTTAEPFRPIAPSDDLPGTAYWLLMCMWGFLWLITQHWVFAVIYLLTALVTTGLFVGAISRIASLHACRDEKISVFQALKFSAAKLPSFITAPLIPLALVLAIGGLMALGGLVMNFPFIGPIIVGALFALAMLGGLAIAFLITGLVAGGPLLYPAIAVEGSDSFDAISRSYHYVFARPFRTGLYGLVALVYGVVTYLFVRLFIYVGMSATHMFVKWGVIGGGSRLGEGADRLDVLWTAPEFQALWGRFSWAAMSGGDRIAAVLIAMWVLPFAALVAAYLISYFASASTCIYLLLRRKVDATDLDEVYVEEPIKEPLEDLPIEIEAEAAKDSDAETNDEKKDSE